MEHFTTYSFRGKAGRPIVVLLAILCCGAVVLAADFRLRLELRLLPADISAAGITGKVKYDQKDTQRKLKVRVRNIPVATTNVEIFVDDVSVGTAAVVGGEIDFQLKTQESDIVPTMTCDSIVEVQDAVTDIILATTD